MIALVGPSGAGKTSFVQAGVIPRLRETGAWLVVVRAARLIGHIERRLVGSGLAGIATAYYLAAHRPDLRIMVVEASQVGLGATGRSTGIIGPGLGMPMRSLRRRYGDPPTVTGSRDVRDVAARHPAEDPGRPGGWSSAWASVSMHRTDGRRRRSRDCE